MTKHKNQAQKQKKAIKPSGVSARVITATNISATILFVLFAFALLAYKKDFLYSMQEMSLFLTTKLFFLDFFKQPGGVISYLGCFLTQFYYYTWLGTGIFVLLLVVLQYFIYRVFEVKRRDFVLCFVPVALLLLFVTQLDYVVYVMKAQGIMFSQLIGLFVSVGILFFYKLCSKKHLQIVYISAIVIFTYPLFGFYTLLGLLLITVFEFFKNRSWLIILLLIALMVIIPLLYQLIAYNNVNISHIYFFALPYKDFIGIEKMWYPLVITLCTLPLLLVLGIRTTQGETGKIRLGLHVAGFLLTLFFVYRFTNKDVNFHNQLKMERLLEEGKWNEIIQIARETENPSYPEMLYRNLALSRTGKIGSVLFSYPQKDEFATSVSAAISLPPVCGPKSLYYYGALNSSYRWAMELGVKFGLNAGFLKLMAKTAIYNNEPELARKYLHTLQQTLFYREWATRYESYLNNPDLLTADEEYKAISRLKSNPHILWDQYEDVKTTILTHCAYLLSDDNQALELSLTSLMLLRNNTLFWPKFIKYVEQNPGKPIPLHIQEAAIFFSQMEQDKGAEQYVLQHIGEDKRVLENFDSFGQMANMYGLDKNKQVYSLFKQRFGKTYWFYYYFLEF